MTFAICSMLIFLLLRACVKIVICANLILFRHHLQLKVWKLLSNWTTSETYVWKSSENDEWARLSKQKSSVALKTNNSLWNDKSQHISCNACIKIWPFVSNCFSYQFLQETSRSWRFLWLKRHKASSTTLLVKLLLNDKFALISTWKKANAFNVGGFN